MKKMKSQIALVTIWTDDIGPMKEFYSTVLGFEIINDLGDYVEFKNDGVRFAICLRKVMYDFSDRFKESTKGQSFELAFPCETIEILDESYQQLIQEGATPVHPPENMPWGQRTALFSDPDGNIHELFTNLS
jgi:uncharacterized glyoxalase superfamily protein PhnB